MQIKAVIFDLDGTITKPYLDFDLLRKELGLAADSGPLLELMEKMSIAERKRAAEILYRYEQEAIEHSALNQGAEETFDWLRQNNIHIGVLTRNTRSNALAVAEKHGLEFDAIVDRQDGPVKPHPFGVEKLCAFFGIAPEKAMLVGDYLFDLQSASAAGATAVLIKTGKKSELFSDFADYTIDRLDEIIGIISDSGNDE